MLGKKCSKKVPKKVFCIHTNIMPKKMRGKNTRNNFSRTTQIVRAKYVGTKFVWKKCEKTFFIFTRISWPKNEGKKPAKKFFQKHTNCASKKYWERSSERSAKNVFHNHTNTVTKKWCWKNARNNFYRNTRIVRAKNVGTKIVG